ncbi:MAG: putative Ig domain-containing protein, partial [Actinomycetota bacterium]|nr:putative Ig domain-containing protein [Actinomycetota bacterium]
MRRAGDGGFILLESVIAISVITVIMSAVGAEFVNGLISTSQQRTQQVAVQVADSAVEQIRALHASDLIVGRDSASVTNQLSVAQSSTAWASVQPWLSKMDPAVDASAAAGSGATAALPTSAVPQKPANVSYAVNNYLGWCAVAAGTTDCVAPSAITGFPAPAVTKFIRAVVAVTWSSSRCGSNACTYVTSTLVSADSDPTFRVNAAPYTAPVIVALPTQTVAVNDAVSVQLKVQGSTGVPQFTWAVSAGALPPGLALGTTGLISGTVTGSAGTFTTTVQVTDAFLRTDVLIINWTVLPAISLTTGPQASTAGVPVN